ncbi:MAG: DUF2807 domain-containing protein [Rikenellaceae bacterium]
MKKLIYIAAAIAVTIAAIFCFSGTRGKGEITSKNFSIISPNRVNSISVSDDFTLIITNDAPQGVVEISTYENIMEMVVVRYNRDSKGLEIRLLDDTRLRGDAKLVARIKPLSSVRFYEASSATISLESQRRLSSCSVKLSDGAKFEGYKLLSSNINVELSGKSEMEISTSGVAKITGTINNSTLSYKGAPIKEENITAELIKGAKIECANDDSDSALPAVEDDEIVDIEVVESEI